ncbi:MAG: hypothetical protein ABSH11_08935 [Verrucomicrobiota bacterium]|jgi:hypothetical protein
MKHQNKIISLLGCGALLLAALFLSGCASATRVSKYNTASSGPPSSPPTGKALVCIHRPKGFVGGKMYAPVWVDTRFIASLGNGHSVACVCEPGKHYFMSFSAEITACIEAELLADQTYDLWIDRYMGTFVNSFKIKPLHQDDKTRKLVAEWTKQNRWIEPAASATDYEHVKLENMGQSIWQSGGLGAVYASQPVSQEKILQLHQEFTSGKRQDKLQHLASDDHR